MLVQNTSAYFLMLHIPESSEAARPKWRRTYDNIQRAIEAHHAYGRIGMPRSLPFKPTPNYTTLTVNPMDFLFTENIMAHMPKIATDLVLDVLMEICGEEVLSTFKRSGTRVRVINEFDPTEYVCLMPYRSELHTASTMPYNESTLDSTALAWVALLEYAMVEPEELIESALLGFGDELSIKNMKSLQEKRIREAKVDQFGYVSTKPGFFHIWTALVDMVFRSHWKGKKPETRCIGILSRFAVILNQTRVGEGSTDHDANGRLIDNVLCGFAGAALVEQANQLSKQTVTLST